MNYFDILLAKKLSGGSPTPPGDTYERKSVTSYPVTGPANYPLPKCDVTVTDADKCEVIVTTDNTITEDSGVYLERQSGGGNRELDAIVGGSVVWNQFAIINSIAWGVGYQGITITKVDNATITVSGLSTANANARAFYTGTNFPANHVYVIDVKDARIGAYIGNGQYSYGIGVCKPTVSVESSVIFYIPNNTDFGEGVTIKPQVFDLTALFGTTIADYIYTLEQSTAGSGIAWLKSYGYLTEDYYGYTANKIESVSVARHVMKDSNDSVIGSYAINPITLRGIPKLNASNQLYYDGDRYEASGRVTRKYKSINLGDLTWTPNASVANAFDANLEEYGVSYNAGLPLNATWICSKYTSYKSTDVGAQTSGIAQSDNGRKLYVKDVNYSDAATFKTAMSGVMLIYELATPTTESTSLFEANQIVDANGTEEYIDAGVEAGTRDVAIPVGHDTKYYNGKAYVKPLTAGTSDTVSMADMGIMPTSPMYISANGEIDAEYWKQVE